MSLSQALLQRGHKLTDQGNNIDALIPKTSKEVEMSFRRILYFLMKDVVFRKDFRNWTFNHDIKRSLFNSYLDLYKKFETRNLKIRDQNKYSKSFEWFISELLKESFGARASGFNITLQDASSDDEFDVISLLDAGLFFAECKGGNSNFEDAVESFVRRDKHLCAKYSLLILERELHEIYNSSELVLYFNQDDAKKHHISNVDLFEKRNKYHFLMVSSTQNRFFFVCNGENLEENIRHIIKYTNIIFDVENYVSEEYPSRPLAFSSKL